MSHIVKNFTIIVMCKFEKPDMLDFEGNDMHRYFVSYCNYWLIGAAYQFIL